MPYRLSGDTNDRVVSGQVEKLLGVSESPPERFAYPFMSTHEETAMSRWNSWFCISCIALLGTSLPAQDFLDPFDEDPLDNPEFWELHEPQTGIFYSIQEEDETWWRMEVPLTGDSGLNFDTWTTVDRAPKLRHAVDPSFDWTIETSVRVDPLAAPLAGDPYLAGLMVQFGEFDIIHWNIGQERGTFNIFMERSGQNNLVTGELETGLTAGTPVGLRVQKTGSTYTFEYFVEAAGDWTVAGSYETQDGPTHVGLVMKTWAGGAVFNVDFDYFDYNEEIPPVEAPEISTPCELDPDVAYVGNPYSRPVEVTGIPFPTVTVTQGPAGLSYDQTRRALTGWTPSSTGDVPITVEVANAGGSSSITWTVQVADEPLEFDDEFDDDPRDDPAYWEFFEPQGGATYSIVEADGTNWFRMDMPPTGDLGVPFDNWTAVNNAPQLRHPVAPDTDFLIETRLRIDPAFPPPPNGTFLAGLMLYFGDFDVLHWNIGQERTQGFNNYNVFMERGGFNNLIRAALEPGLLTGTPVDLRIEKKCSTYSFSYRLESDGVWTFADTYETTDQPIYVGLIAKNWGAGTAYGVDFDYFNFIGEEPPSELPTISSPCALGDPDIAWAGMPYARALEVDGLPTPTVAVTTGPAMAYDGSTGVLSGWTPDAVGSESLTIEATNALGTSSLNLDVQVEAEPTSHDDEFDEDPRNDPGYWEFYEPQAGGLYSIFEDEDENSWFRIDLPAIGNDGLNFDHWLAADNAPQLRHAVDAEEDFLIETRVRFDANFPPLATDPFLAGLTVVFGVNDLIQWTAGNERVRGFDTYNIVMERSGSNNLIIGGFEPNLISLDPLVQGAPVDLRIERKCDLYNFFYRLAADTDWTLAGSYRTPDAPTYVGLVAKNWGAGVPFVTDFDYFDILEAGGNGGGDQFLRGDANGSGEINLTDGIAVLNFLFLGGEDSPCRDAADINNDSNINLTDGIGIFNFLFLGGSAPEAPWPECGVDPDADPAVTCETPHASCGV